MVSTRAEIGERKRTQTRAVLIEAAIRVFARLGPEAPTIDDFIAEAGFARGTFYNYFETREELLIVVATFVAEQIERELATVHKLRDPADLIGCAVRTYIRKAASNPTWGWIIVHIAFIAAPLGASMQKNLRGAINKGFRTGRLRAPSKQSAADLVLGSGIMGMRSVLRGEADINHAEHVAQTVLAAMGVEDAAEVAHRSLDEHMLATRTGRSKTTKTKPKRYIKKT